MKPHQEPPPPVWSMLRKGKSVIHNILLYEDVHNVNEIVQFRLTPQLFRVATVVKE